MSVCLQFNELVVGCERKEQQEMLAGSSTSPHFVKLECDVLQLWDMSIKNTIFAILFILSLSYEGQLHKDVYTT